MSSPQFPSGRCWSRSSAPHPSEATRDRSAETTSAGSSPMSRMACQRIEGSESSSHCVTDLFDFEACDSATELEHLVALAELELVGDLLQELRVHETAARQHALQRRQPRVVVAELPAACLRGGDLADQGLAELLPREEATLGQRHRHAEGAALPGRVEDQLAVA